MNTEIYSRYFFYAVLVNLHKNLYLSPYIKTYKYEVLSYQKRLIY